MKKLVKKNIFLAILLIPALLLTACGKTGGVGGTNNTMVSISEVSRTDISEDTQIVELNSSKNYYELSFKEDTSCVYFYAIAYDKDGKLADKSIVTTLPVGITKDEVVAVNGTIPEGEYPSYAIGIESESGEQYITINQKDGKLVLEKVKDKADFLLWR